MIRKMVSLVLGITMTLAAQGQQKSDTVIVSLGRTSRVVFTMQDRSDLEILKHYNFQELFKDILQRIENTDSAVAPVSSEEPVAQMEEHDHDDWRRNDNDKY